MGPADKVEVLLCKELRDLVRAESVGNSPVVHAPAVDITARVRPEEVAEQASVRDVGGSGEATDLVKGGKVGREAAVHAEDLIVNEGGNGEAVEAVGEELPEADIEAALALIVEAVDAVDGGALVVAA